MGLAAMQVQRHREDGELRHDQHVDQHGQPTGVRQAVGQEIEYCIKHGETPRCMKSQSKRGVSVPASMDQQNIVAPICDDKVNVLYRPLTPTPGCMKLGPH